MDVNFICFFINNSLMRIVAINTSPLLSGEMAMFARNVTIVTFVVDGSLTPVATRAVKIRGSFEG
jgi:hypothetical protein